MHMRKTCISGIFFFISLFPICGIGNQEQQDGEGPLNQEIMDNKDMEESSILSSLEEWTEILGMGIEIGIYTHLNKKVASERVWEFIHGIGWDAQPDKKGLLLHFYLDGNKPLVSYMLVPHQNLFNKKDPLSNKIVPDNTFVTVTMHALVFGPLFRKNSVEDHDLLKKIEKIISYTTYKKIHNEIISEQTEEPIPQSLQIISIKVFPFYMIMDVALPGSIVPDDKTLLTLSGNRMINLSLIPDKGTITQRWIAPGNNKVQDKNIEELKDIIRYELGAFLENIANKSVDPGTEVARINVLNTIIQKAQKNFKNVDEEKKYISFILRLLALEQSVGQAYGFDYGDMFPDYEPKITPDTILDYRPALSDIFLQLPKNTLVNLKTLILLHEKYFKKADNNHGNWIHGNMILGAPEKEYIPSDDELILCEIDGRIRNILLGTEVQILKKYYKENKLLGKKIILVQIDIWHVDVMGSGRFFYSGSLQREKFNLGDS